MRQRPDLLEASGPEKVHLSFRCKVISCMSEYLLLVSEALATEQFENCTVVSHRNHWPTMGELQRLAARQLEDRTLRRIQYFEILNLLAWSMGTVSSVVYSARS